MGKIKCFIADFETIAESYSSSVQKHVIHIQEFLEHWFVFSAIDLLHFCFAADALHLAVRTPVNAGIINNNIFFAFQGIYGIMINFIFPRMVRALSIYDSIQTIKSELL